MAKKTIKELKRCLKYMESVRGEKLVSMKEPYARGFQSGVSWAIEALKLYVNVKDK